MYVKCCIYLSEGASADYIVTGAWSAKAAKEVKSEQWQIIALLCSFSFHTCILLLWNKSKLIGTVKLKSILILFPLGRKICQSKSGFQEAGQIQQ